MIPNTIQFYRPSFTFANKTYIDNQEQMVSTHQQEILRLFVQKLILNQTRTILADEDASRQGSPQMRPRGNVCIDAMIGRHLEKLRR